VALQLVDCSLDLRESLLQRGDRRARRGELRCCRGDLDRGSDEPRFEHLGSVAPLAPMIVTAHRRL